MRAALFAIFAYKAADCWEQTDAAEWDEMTPALPVPLPGAHGPPTGHVAPRPPRVSGEWYAKRHRRLRGLRLYSLTRVCPARRWQTSWLDLLMCISE